MRKPRKPELTLTDFFRRHPYRCGVAGEGTPLSWIYCSNAALLDATCSYYQFLVSKGDLPPHYSTYREMFFGDRWTPISDTTEGVRHV